jgi:hypothetical protein
LDCPLCRSACTSCRPSFSSLCHLETRHSISS